MANQTVGSNTILSKAQVENLVSEAILWKASIDFLPDGCNTLLHLAVEHDLFECVMRLLSAGANINALNSLGLKPKDIAIINGNQILLQMLTRREDYGKFLSFLDEPDHSDISMGAEGPNVSKYLATCEPRMLQLTFGTIYEDYFDWTDFKRCFHLRVMNKFYQSAFLL
jgi:hypothetical protein